MTRLGVSSSDFGCGADARGPGSIRRTGGTAGRPWTTTPHSRHPKKSSPRHTHPHPLLGSARLVAVLFRPTRGWVRPILGWSRPDWGPVRQKSARCDQAFARFGPFLARLDSVWLGNSVGLASTKFWAQFGWARLYPRRGRGVGPERGSLGFQGGVVAATVGRRIRSGAIVGLVMGVFACEGVRAHAGARAYAFSYLRAVALRPVGGGWLCAHGRSLRAPMAAGHVRLSGGGGRTRLPPSTPWWLTAPLGRTRPWFGPGSLLAHTAGPRGCPGGTVSGSAPRGSPSATPRALPWGLQSAAGTASPAPGSCRCGLSSPRHVPALRRRCSHLGPG